MPDSALADPLQSLTQAFLLNHPLKAARKLEAMAPADVAALLQQQKLHVMVRVLEKLAPSLGLSALQLLSPPVAAKALEVMDVSLALNLLAQLPVEQRATLLDAMQKLTADEFRMLLEYPDNTVGRLMNPSIIAFNQRTTAAGAIAQLRSQGVIQ